ncbi:FAD-dependent oxidoreductase [Glutamicibacter sp. V16R2B1]|nr:FAD-dependent oxidoreductase [Glutamicibacter sp. V16R2B1]
MNNVSSIPTSPEQQVDVLVIGSGAGGMAAAVTAAYHGLKVLVVEKATVCGGATSFSGGWAWTPGNPLAKADGVDEDRELFRSYLRGRLGDNYDSERVEAFLEAVPHMVGFFQEHTSLQFTPGKKINDIYGDTPGAGTGHRSVGPAPFDARKVRPELRAKMRHQLYATSFLGMGIMAGDDLGKFLAASQGSIPGLLHAAKRFTTHLFDLAIHRRNMQLVNGTALTARLLASADNLGVQIQVDTAAEELLTDDDGRVTGARLKGTNGEYEVSARRGVILATGGFPQNIARRAELFPKTPHGTEHWTLTPPECNGSGLDMALAVGAKFNTAVASPAAWCPVSLVRYPNGTTGTFPHIMDRAKPGSIGVLANGRRFVNEANGYYDYVDAMIKATPEGAEVASWQIADARYVRRYPLGMAKPLPVPLTPYLRTGYLVKGRTLSELAEKCGIDATNLERTVAEFNANAREGLDPEFGRGETSFNRYGGDAAVTPNPSLAPLEKGPFYAVKVVPGSFGTFAGIDVDARARVLSEDGAVIQGLYAVGNDQVSVMGGHYPAGGINLGPALTFGYVAARDAAEVTEYEDELGELPLPAGNAE